MVEAEKKGLEAAGVGLFAVGAGTVIALAFAESASAHTADLGSNCFDGLGVSTLPELFVNKNSFEDQIGGTESVVINGVTVIDKEAITAANANTTIKFQRNTGHYDVKFTWSGNTVGIAQGFDVLTCGTPDTTEAPASTTTTQVPATTVVATTQPPETTNAPGTSGAPTTSSAETSVPVSSNPNNTIVVTTSPEGVVTTTTTTPVARTTTTVAVKPPTKELPTTGSETGVAVSGGLSLIIGGAAIVRWMKNSRRRTA